MDDGEQSCSEVESPSRKVKLTRVTDDDKLRGMMKEAVAQGGEEVLNQCMPLLELSQGLCVQPWPTDDTYGNPVSAG